MQHDTLTTKEGYKTSRDVQDRNIRYKCPFCTTEKRFLTSSYGLHILREHADMLFNDSNVKCDRNRKQIRKKISSDKGYVILEMKNDFKKKDVPDDTFWCLGCKTCFKSEVSAANHAKKHPEHRKAHESELYSLRDKYPEVGPDGTIKQPTLKKKERLEGLICDLIEHIRFIEKKHNLPAFDYEDKYGDDFVEWDVVLREEELKQYWTLEESEEETVEEEVKEEKEKEEEVEELLVPKPMSKADYVRSILSEKDINDLSTSITTGQKIDVPELQSLKTILPPSTPQQEEVPAPPKAPKTAEIQPISTFRNLSPIQKLMMANPGVSSADIYQMAKAMGVLVQTEEHQKPCLILNTKVKRQPKQI